MLKTQTVEASVDLIDYKSLRTEELTADMLRAQHDDGPRLLWTSDADHITGFAFRAQYSYEREAVSEASEYQMLDGAQDWTLYCGEKSSAPDAISQLLDATLWRGRPVLQGMADYWLALDLSENTAEYESLLQIFRERGNTTGEYSQTAINQPFYVQKADHNLIAPIWRLLWRSEPEANNQPTAFTWTLPAAQAFAGIDQSSEQLRTVVANVEIRLWFMDERVLLLQWRLLNYTPEKTDQLRQSLCYQGEDGESAKLAHEVRVAKQGMRQLLHTGCSMQAGYLSIEDWLKIHQSLRWESWSFQQQVREGRIIPEIENALSDVLKRMLDFPANESSSVGEKLLQLAENRPKDGGQPTSMHDARRYTSWAVAPLSAAPGQRFNGALQRAWAHLLGNDTPYEPINSCCDNFPFDPEFSRDWIDRRSYKRWQATGLQYGFSDFSAAAMGTSSYFRGQVFQNDWPGLYSELTRFCLYQQTRLRALAMAFSQVLEHKPLSVRRSSAADNHNFKQMQLRMEKMRDELQRFNRTAWFHRVSTQLQPEELYQQQAGAMDLQALHHSVRDEFTDISEWLASVQSIRQRRRDWTLALIGTAIAVPGVLQIWGAGESVADAAEPSRGIFGALAAMFASGDFWLLLATLLTLDQVCSKGAARRRVHAWLQQFF